MTFFCCLQYHFLQYTKHTGCSQALLTSLRITGHVIPFPSLIFGTSLLCFYWAFPSVFPLFSFRLRPWGLIHASERRKRGIDSSYPRILLDERPFRIRVNPPPGSRLVRTAALLVLVGWIRSLQLRVQMHPFASRSLHGGLRVWPMLPREISFVFNPKSFLFLLSHSEYRSPLRRGNKN